MKLGNQDHDAPEALPGSGLARRGSVTPAVESAPPTKPSIVPPRATREEPPQVGSVAVPSPLPTLMDRVALSLWATGLGAVVLWVAGAAAASRDLSVWLGVTGFGSATLALGIAGVVREIRRQSHELLAMGRQGAPAWGAPGRRDSLVVSGAAARTREVDRVRKALRERSATSHPTSLRPAPPERPSSLSVTPGGRDALDLEG